MKIEVVLDKDNYIESYTLINDGGHLNDSIAVEVEDLETENDIQAFAYTYDCYKLENGKIIFDNDKLFDLMTEQPPLTKEQELEKRIVELENMINVLATRGLI